MIEVDRLNRPFSVELFSRLGTTLVACFQLHNPHVQMADLFVGFDLLMVYA